MVNRVILDYLKTNKDKYPMDDLKQKILSSGYSEEDFNEALGIFKGSNKKTSMAPLVPSGVGGSSFSSGGLKWIKFGSISGFILLAFVLTNFVLGFFYKSIFSVGEVSNVLIYLLEGFVFLIILIFYFGFIKLSKFAESKFLKIISWIVICLVVLIFIFGSQISFKVVPLDLNDSFKEVGQSFALQGSQSAGVGLSGFSILTGLVAGDFSLSQSNGNSLGGLTGIAAQQNINSILEPSSDFLKSILGMVFEFISQVVLHSIRLMILIFLFLLLLLFLFLFSIGLIRFKIKINPAFFAGGFGAVVRAFGFCFYALFLIFFFFFQVKLAGLFLDISPSLIRLGVLSIMSGSLGKPTILFWVLYSVLNLLCMGILLTESLVLFNGSKRFES